MTCHWEPPSFVLSFSFNLPLLKVTFNIFFLHESEIHNSTLLMYPRWNLLKLCDLHRTGYYACITDEMDMWKIKWFTEGVSSLSTSGSRMQPQGCSSELLCSIKCLPAACHSVLSVTLNLFLNSLGLSILISHISLPFNSYCRGNTWGQETESGGGQNPTLPSPSTVLLGQL